MQEQNDLLSTVEVDKSEDTSRDELALVFIQAASLLANPTSNISHKTVFETIVQNSFNELYNYYLLEYDGDDLGVEISLNIYLRNINAGTLTNHGLNSDLLNMLFRNARK